MSKTNKKALSRTERIQLTIEKQNREQALQKALREHKNFTHSLSICIKHLPTEKLQTKLADGTPLMVLVGLHNQIAKKEIIKREAFYQLLAQLEKQHCYKLLSEEKYLNGIFHIALFACYFIRDIIAWKRQSYQPDKQFASLLRFLFARYAVPQFMDHAWLPGGSAKEQQWFIDIATGVSVRKLNGLPVVLTRKMANEFLHAPQYCSIHGALRYAQVVALGGDEWLAWHINATLLGRNGFRHDDFWIKVVRFLAEAPLFDVRRLAEIIDYLNHQRVAQPDFSLKGRTLDSLMRLVDEWHTRMHHERKFGGKLCWETSGIQGFDYQEEEGNQVKIYRIREMLSSNELRAEGKAMNHCVYTYAHSCYTGKCAIFSLSVDTIFSLERLVTIEVDLKIRQIVQAKARFNKIPDTPAMDMIKNWAATAGLGLWKYL